MNANVQHKQRLIIGLGLTGLSVARWCVRHQLAFDLCDSRNSLANLAAIEQEFPQAQLTLGALDKELLSQYQELIVSPGVSIQQPAIQYAVSQGVKVRGDIDIFAEHCQQPIVAITGSNGKSTVTSLVGEMLAATGLKVAVGGNIGLPALDLPAADIYVLELSSFQLETAHQLKAKVAVVLNISEDHLDRYTGMADYIAAKHRIFEQAERIVVNRQDASTYPTNKGWTTSFGLDLAEDDEFGLLNEQGISYLSMGAHKLVAANDLKIKGQHNHANALAAFAILQQLEINLAKAVPALLAFAGLPYRCQWVGEQQGVAFYNDSKGTNVGSTVAAIQGLGANLNGRIVLLAGGEGKGQDFTPLASVCEQYVSAVVGFGKDAGLIGAALQGHCAFEQVATMSQAFARATAIAKTGDLVLLSPACASLDQFKDYNERGARFTELVEGVL